MSKRYGRGDWILRDIDAIAAVILAGSTAVTQYIISRKE